MTESGNQRSPIGEFERSRGLEGEGPVADMRDLPAALGRGLDAVARGATRVIDVVVMPGDVD